MLKVKTTKLGSIYDHYEIYKQVFGISDSSKRDELVSIVKNVNPFRWGLASSLDIMSGVGETSKSVHKVLGENVACTDLDLVDQPTRYSGASFLKQDALRLDLGEEVYDATWLVHGSISELMSGVKDLPDLAVELDNMFNYLSKHTGLFILELSYWFLEGSGASSLKIPEMVLPKYLQDLTGCKSGTGKLTQRFDAVASNIIWDLSINTLGGKLQFDTLMVKYIPYAILYSTLNRHFKLTVHNTVNADPSIAISPRSVGMNLESQPDLFICTSRNFK